MHIKLINKGQISIPKKIKNQLNFKEGDYLFVYNNRDRIFIEKDHQNKTLNQCVFSHGKITIPAELRRLLGISMATPLSIEICIKTEKIIIEKVKNGIQYGDKSVLVTAD